MHSEKLLRSAKVLTAASALGLAAGMASAGQSRLRFPVAGRPWASPIRSRRSSSGSSTAAAATSRAPSTPSLFRGRPRTA